MGRGEGGLNLQHKLGPSGHFDLCFVGGVGFVFLGFVPLTVLGLPAQAIPFGAFFLLRNGMARYLMTYPQIPGCGMGYNGSCGWYIRIRALL